MLISFNEPFGVFEIDALHVEHCENIFVLRKDFTIALELNEITVTIYATELISICGVSNYSRVIDEDMQLLLSLLAFTAFF
jgi:hypothetical protein